MEEVRFLFLLQCRLTKQQCKKLESAEPKMKKFNQVIKIEVSVDTIAEQLLSVFKDDFKHKELVTEHIIGSSLDAGKISYIYNSLNGYTSEIDFKVGDIVDCSTSRYTYYKLDENGNPVKHGKQEPIGICEVIEINLYSAKKLKVRSIYLDKNDSRGYFYTDTTDWVLHLDCQKIPDGIMPSLEEMNAQIASQASLDDIHAIVGH